MRVISGIRKGHKLVSPKNMEIRPTEDRVKESMFNILGKITDDTVVLDLFAGTGGIGIEFLSRGARKAYFVDKSKDAMELIKINISKTRFDDKAILIQKDAVSSISALEIKENYYDYIFIDPPYKEVDLFHKILKAISISKLINEKTIIIIEHDKELTLNEIYGKIIQTDHRKYGSKCMTYYKLNEVE